MRAKVKVNKRSESGRSPWPLIVRVRMTAWNLCWTTLCHWTPKPFNTWRLLWLKIFGAQIGGRPFVHQRARIHMPWNLILGDRSCIGDRATVYSLDAIEIGEGAVVAQEAYLCTGTHVFDLASLPLATAPIVVQKNAFVGARAFILPGVTVGERSVIGACSVVTSNVAPFTKCAGNPCRLIPTRNGEEGAVEVERVPVRQIE